MMLIAGTVMAVTHPVRGALAIAYLPSIGPAPMRFELAADPGPAFDWKLLRSLSPATNSSPVPVPVAETITNTNADTVLKAGSLSSTNDTITAASTPAADPGAGSHLEIPPGSMVLPSSSDESSSPVTAQILAGFFKPTSGGKKLGGRDSAGAAMFMPVDVGFTPPSPSPAPESKAVYKSP